jgi:hypothetical protein
MTDFTEKVMTIWTFLALAMLLAGIAGAVTANPTNGRLHELSDAWGFRVSDSAPHQLPADDNGSENETNHPPIITYMSPPNNSVYVYNSKITFSAKAFEPDGDSMTFFWRDSYGILLKADSKTTVSTFSMVLPGGKIHVVVLEVQDGKGGVTRGFIYIKVMAKTESSDSGWPCGPLFLLPLASITLVVRRRYHGP